MRCSVYISGKSPACYIDRFVLVSVSFSSMIGAVELHLSGRWLCGSPIIWIGLALWVNTKLNCLEINGYRIKYGSVLAARISNQTSLKGLDTGIYCK
jgi:hypothetical protein